LWDDKNGDLLAGGGDTNAAPVGDLTEGVNILRVSATWNNELAFSKWKGVGQQPGNDNDWPPRAISATGTNPSNPANWFNLWHAEHPGDAQDMVARVNYEQALSGQAGLQIQVTVVGWKNPAGNLWDVDQNITLLSPMIFPTQKTPITFKAHSCLYEQDNANGTTTTLSLVLPEFMSSIPINNIPDYPAGSGLPSQPMQPATPDQPD
jgi:prophage tail gpP-like protein